MLLLHDVWAQYGRVPVLTGISLEVPDGSAVALIGANGAGKTTILRVISGVLRPTRGTVELDGQRLDGMRPEEIVRRHRVIHVPEGRGIFANLTVAENLRLGSYCRRGEPGVKRDLESVLDLFPVLRERWHQPGGTLSGGEQQMLAIGRALVARPRLLILDEPSLGLAPVVVQRIFAVIRRINAEGTTLLFVEQNAKIAMAVAQYGYVVEVGRIAAHGPADELRNSELLLRSYLGALA